jgi:hypothetical protein
VWVAGCVGGGSGWGWWLEGGGEGGLLSGSCLACLGPVGMLADWT